MDKEQEFQRAQNALNGDDGRTGTIHHANRERDQQLITKENKRKNEQALLALAQEFADIKARILGQLPELHNKIDETRKLVQKAFSEAESTAVRDDKSRMVFRDKDGNARYEDGVVVPTDEAANITWREGATSWEEYKKLKDILEKLDEYDLELVTIEDDIHRMGDDATPEKVERLREHEQRIKQFELDLDKTANELQVNSQSQSYSAKPVNTESVPSLNL